MARELVLDVDFLHSNAVPEMCILSGKKSGLVFYTVGLERKKADSGENALRWILWAIYILAGGLLRFFMRRMLQDEMSRDVYISEFPIVVNRVSSWLWKIARRGGVWLLWLTPVVALVMAVRHDVVHSPEPMLTYILFGVIPVVGLAVAWLVAAQFTTVGFSSTSTKVLRVTFPTRLNFVYAEWAEAYDDWKSGKRRGRSVQVDGLGDEEANSKRFDKNGDLIP